VVDWGVLLDVRGGKETPVEAEYPIQTPEDWRRLRPHRGDEGEYLIVLEAQRIAIEERRSDVPLVQTVFSPLTSCLHYPRPGVHRTAQDPNGPFSLSRPLGLGGTKARRAFPRLAPKRAVSISPRDLASLVCTI
jgi:hypothetical protein